MLRVWVAWRGGRSGAWRSGSVREAVTGYVGDDGVGCGGGW